MYCVPITVVRLVSSSRVERKIGGGYTCDSVVTAKGGGLPGRRFASTSHLRPLTAALVSRVVFQVTRRTLWSNRGWSSSVWPRGGRVFRGVETGIACFRVCRWQDPRTLSEPRSESHPYPLTRISFAYDSENKKHNIWTVERMVERQNGRTIGYRIPVPPETNSLTHSLVRMSPTVLS